MSNRKARGFLWYLFLLLIFPSQLKELLHYIRAFCRQYSSSYFYFRMEWVNWCRRYISAFGNIFSSVGEKPANQFLSSSSIVFISKPEHSIPVSNNTKRYIDCIPNPATIGSKKLIGSSPHNSVYSCLKNGTSAHCTGFKCYIKCSFLTKRNLCPNKPSY